MRLPLHGQRKCLRVVVTKTRNVKEKKMNDNEVFAATIKAVALVLVTAFITVTISEAVDKICSAWKESKSVRIILTSEIKGE